MATGHKRAQTPACKGSRSATIMYSYLYTLTGRAIVATFDLSAKNLDAFETDHWLSSPSWATAADARAPWARSPVGHFLRRRAQHHAGPTGNNGRAFHWASQPGSQATRGPNNRRHFEAFIILFAGRRLLAASLERNLNF